MTPAAALRSHKQFIAEQGETIRVRRWSGVGAERGKVEASVLARVTGYQPRELAGGIIQGDIKVIIVNDPAATVPDGCVSLQSLLPLSSNDSLVIRGVERAIKGVDDNTRRIQGVLIGLDIQASGG